MPNVITQAANGMARPNSITITAPNEAVPFTTGTYAYDAAGNIKTMGSDHFRYDRYSRLVEAQMGSITPARTQTYGFDAYGNMTSVATTSGPSETFQVIGNTNRITLPPGIVAQAQYDAGGNLTSWSDPTTTATYTWDLFNRLAHWGNGAEGWSYVYTADDERLWAIKDIAGATHSNWTFRGLGNEVLVRDERRPDGGSLVPPAFVFSVCPSGAPLVGIFCDNFETGNLNAWSTTSNGPHRTLTQYAYREGKLLASLEIGGSFRDFGLDHLGSIRATADIVLGEIGVRHTYFPFGREATSTGQDDEVMKFTGHERDLQSTTTNTIDDLDYMHARYSSPLTARFLSTDPVGGSPKQPQGWNRYAYVRGNPLKLVDPDGRSAVVTCDSKACVAAVDAQIVVQPGSVAQRAAASEFKAATEGYWGAQSLVSRGGKMTTFDVKMSIVERGSEDPSKDSLSVVTGRGVANVTQKWGPDSGEIFTEDATGNPSGFAGIAPHETGHLMGLRDLYDPVLKMVPYSPGPNVDIMYGVQPGNSANSANFIFSPGNFNVLLFGQP